MYIFTAPELFGAFEKDKRFNAVVGSTPRKVIVPLNNTRKPFDNVKVRQAMMSAIDRKAVIEAAYSGYGTPIGSHYAPTDPGYVDETGVWPHDVAKAKQLLREAGLEKGFSATMKCPQMTYVMRTCEVVQAMEAEIGINLKIETSEFPAKWIEDVFKKHDYEVTAMSHAEPMDIGIYARPDYYFDYHNPAFDALIKKASETADEAARNAIYGEAQKMLAEQVPALYIFDLPHLSVLNPKLKGLWESEPISEAYVRDAYWEN
jgi:peptide/nickel transport system substrate-binding protein